MISGFHAKGNPWPPLRSAASTTNPFLLLVSRSRYAIIRKRLISLPVFKKNETKHTFGICHVNLFIRWTKKRICFAVCTNDSRENGYNRLGKEDMLLFLGRRRKEGDWIVCIILNGNYSIISLSGWIKKETSIEGI